MLDLNYWIFKLNYDKVNKILTNGKNINSKNELDIHPIIAAINSDNPQMLKFIISKGADVNIENGKPLIEAIDLMIDGMIQQGLVNPDSDSISMIRILLDHGANLNIVDEDGNKILDILNIYSNDRATFDKLKDILRPIIKDIDKRVSFNKEFD